jgi:spermidine synthase
MDAEFSSRDSPTIWFVEQITPELLQSSAVRRIICEVQTPFQRVQIIETGPFGRSLVLDGKMQSAEADEWVYHESLVQMVMMAHEHPQRVFIAGGGEGATAREVLRHANVAEVVMVDLDEKVVALCREHLPNHHQGAFDDPRLALHCADAVAYLREHDATYDVLIVDIADPLESGPAVLLYTQEFYRLAASRLAPGGLLVTQAGPIGPLDVTEVFTAIHRTMASVFDHAAPYGAYVPSFGTAWGFVAAGMADAPRLAALTPVDVERRLADRVGPSLRYYDGLAHAGMLQVPKYVRDAIAAETRVITDANPLFAV